VVTAHITMHRTGTAPIPAIAPGDLLDSSHGGTGSPLRCSDAQDGGNDEMDSEKEASE